MIRLLAAEWLKTKHTVIRWVTFFIPVVISLCVVAYLSYRSNLTTQFIFNGFFTVWTAIILPVGVGILSGYIIHEEELAGNFVRFLNTGISRSKLYIGKFLLLIFCLLSCTVISTLILCVGMKIATPYAGNVSLFMLASLLAVIGSLPILSIHLWISFLWGLGSSIGISIGGILMAALIGGTSLGHYIWPFVPWAWPVKMAMFPSIYLMNPTTLLITKAKEQLTSIFIIIIITLTILQIGSIIWFKNWEGRINAG